MTNCCTPADKQETEANRAIAHTRVQRPVLLVVPSMLRYQFGELFFHGQVEGTWRMVSTMNVKEFPDVVNYTSHFGLNARCFTSF
jgi:hypothetical protein